MGAGHGQQLMTCRALHRNMHIQRACWEQSQDPATNSVMIHSPLGQNSKANLKDIRKNLDLKINMQVSLIFTSCRHFHLTC